ncbi:MAG: aminopeptidase P family protein [Oscillospiraceae bacterium]|nr:aminopeptidase P family protein [Oscillospiraceae bacterium]
METIYQTRREALLNRLEPSTAAFIFSGKAPMRSQDESYPFAVDRSFFYLTGIDRENMILLMKKYPDGRTEETLFIEPYSEFWAKWVGGRMKADEAKAVSGIADIRYLEDFDGALNRLVSSWQGLGTLTVGLDLWRYQPDQTDTPAHGLAKRLQERYPAVRIADIRGELAALRMLKDENEIAQMRLAQDATNTAIRAMMRHARPGMNEAELEGAFDFSLACQGEREHAFQSIVAGGKRATTLHYSDNNQVVEDGELVLIDLGSAHNHYCADISRTFPVNGRFTPRQKALYDTVLAAQELVIRSAKPGMTLGELNTLVVDYYKEALEPLGLLKDGKSVGDYYYHGVSHQLGLDTHDVGNPTMNRLQPGMVITVEPGLYVEEEGIGIRIENDILITETGAEDLSAGILKTTEEIESWMKSE